MSKLSSNTLLVIFLLSLFMSCETSSDKPLHIFGRTQYKEVNGSIDTVFHTIPAFSFVDQDSMEVTEKTFEGKIYVTDFFFGTCPTICPTMKQQLLRVYDRFKDNPEFAILSHTIDPDHDTVAYLKNYSMNIGVPDNKTWHFVTGDKDEIYAMGSEKAYLVPAGEDANAPGGFMHSGAFLLIDKERRIRGKYDGTKPRQVDALMSDILKLLAEYE